MDDESEGENRSDPEIHAVPTSLNPAKTEGFALLPEEDEDGTPSATVNVADVETAITFLRVHKEAADSSEHGGRLGEMEAAVSALLAWYRANGGS